MVTIRRTMALIATATLTGVTVTACRSTTTTSQTMTTTTITRRTTPALAATPPAIVDGVPMAVLARQAVNEARAWSDPRPSHVRVVVSTQAGLESVLGYSYGATVPVFVVALQGRLFCGPSCDISDPALLGRSTPTTMLSVVPIAYMAFTVPVWATPGSGGSLSVGRIDPDLSKLGQVYNLQPYVDGLR
jgi:hypothetical protein